MSLKYVLDRLFDLITHTSMTVVDYNITSSTHLEYLYGKLIAKHRKNSEEESGNKREWQKSF